MDCEQALALISARIDREILPAENAWLSEHLRDCPACRATAEAFALQHKDLIETFKPRRAAVGATANRVKASVAALCGSPPKRRLPIHRGVLIGMGVGAAWLVAAVLLFTFLSSQTNPALPPPIPTQPPPAVQPTTTAQSDRLIPRPLPKGPETKPLQPGQTVTTAPGERKRVTLPDRSAVYLNENTTFTLAVNHAVTLKTGTAYFELVQDARQPGINGLAVTTDDRAVFAEGTKFAMQVEPEGTRLIAVTGDIMVGDIQHRGPGETPNVLHAGEMLAPLATVATTSSRLSHVLDWTHDLIAASEPALVPASSHDGGELIAVDANGQEAKLSLRKYHVDVHLEDGFARTTIDQTYFNHHPWRLEGTFYFPLPPDASLSRLAMYVDGELNEGGMVDREFGRTVYQRIVNNQRDPALLEWVDGSTFKMRVFPLEGRQEKRIILSYTQRVPTLYGRAQYRFPAGHNLQTVRDWSFHGVVKNGANYLATSPTHPAMKRTVQGDDLVLDDAADNCKVDRDVVLELTDTSFVAEEKDAVRFSCAEMDGNEYLMMRYRPQLPAQKKRERRDWIFLYETSADRDPLLARTQIEVIRGMLQNAEQGDSYRILAVSNRLTAMYSQAVPAMPGNGPVAVPIAANNIAEVVDFLEQTHLVGALDLGAGFRSAGQCAALSDHPYLVHIGGGYTGMGTPQDELAKLVPAKAKYIGIGVGKHWNRAFMKQCAEKTGGYYTQINPDDSISWRTFDLMATLNTPRLLDVKVTDARVHKDDENRPQFLLDANAIAQGEELCAVTRLAIRDGSHGWRKLATPGAVTISGLLDGVKFEREVRVEKVASQAAYIPRTWAKLEIDRLLAEDARKNMNTIIELSKALYVMTPFTSLLVLENEAMYKEFKVDRGRKDHWAMYPCPEKIPVVYEPDPTMPTDVRNAPKGLKPTANEVLQSVCVRVPPTWLNGGYQNSTNGLRLRTGAEVLRHQSMESWSDISPGLDELGERDNKLGKLMRKTRVRRVPYTVTRGGGQSPRYRDVVVEEFGFSGEQLGMFGSERSPQIVEFSPNGRVKLATGKDSVDGIQLWDEAPGSNVHFRQTIPLGNEVVAVRGFYNVNSKHDPLADFYGDSFIKPRMGEPAMIRGGRDSVDVSWAVAGDIFAPAAQRSKKSHILGLRDGELGIDDSRQLGTGIELFSEGMLSAPPRSQNSLIYQRQSYSRDPRLFTDLLGYAPGLNTSEADILAVLEAEAMPDLRQAPGRIDPKARKLIDATRTNVWSLLTLPGDKDHPEQVILFDCSGRYAYERTPALGLHEIVTCDGTTLVHQYPEIGLAGRRAVSRFHRAELAGLLPWLLPPAEDLARGVDLKCVDDNTIALLPQWLRDVKPQQEVPTYGELHLIFKDGRFAERRLVQMPANKTVAREVYDGEGGVRQLDGDGKEVGKFTRKLGAAAEPNLKPALADFVVLPLPYRSRTNVMEKLDLNSSVPLSADENGCFEYLDTDACVKLLTALVAEQNVVDAQLLFRRCFAERGDQRRGLFTLLAAAGVDVSHEPAFRQRFAETPDDDLLTYVALAGNALYKYVQQRLPLHGGRSAEQGGTFLRELSDAQALLYRWDSLKGESLFSWQSRQGDIKRCRAFLDRHPRDVLGQALLHEMQDRTKCATDEERERRNLYLAKLWGRRADANQEDYRARYEQACSLNYGNKRVAAEKLMKDLYARTLKAGVLPPIDGRFQNALQELENQPAVDDWNPLIRTTGQQFIKDKRYGAVVALASQCRSLSEPALADSLLADLLAAAKTQADGWATELVVIQYYAQANELARADALLHELLPLDELPHPVGPGVPAVPAGGGGPIPAMGPGTGGPIPAPGTPAVPAGGPRPMAGMPPGGGGPGAAMPPGGGGPIPGVAPRRPVNEKLAQAPALWRLAAQLAERRGQEAQAIAYLERALALEYPQLPDVIDLQSWRNDYGKLLDNYLKLAQSAKALNAAPPPNLLERTVRAIDRWRAHDPEAGDACKKAADIFASLGEQDLAWDYYTTQLLGSGLEVSRWQCVAGEMNQSGAYQLADRALAVASEVEPTNAEVVWQRAKNLRQAGQTAEADQLMHRLANEKWPERYQGIRSNARYFLNGK